MARVYLETSFVSACVTDRDDTQSAYRRQASLDWWTKQRSRHELRLSAEVIEELKRPAFRRRDEALRMVSGITAIDINEEVIGLAQVLVRELVMPAPASGGDALHVAAATVHRIDYMLTWNVRHLANPNKLQHLQRLCIRAGYVAPSIITPELLWESDE